MRVLQNRLRGSVPFDASKYPYLYGLIVVKHRTARYRPMVAVPTLKELNSPLHVLSFDDFVNLCRRVDTPYDLINYLEHRTDVLIPTMDPEVHGEQDVFAYYLERFEDVFALRANARGESVLPEEFRRSADALRLYVTGRHEDAEAGLEIDYLVHRLETDSELWVPEDAEPRSQNGDDTRLAAAIELAGLPRARRMLLGRLLRGASSEAERSGEMQFRSAHSPKRRDCSLLMASPLPPERRQERSTELRAMTRLLKEYREMDKALGVATECGENMGRSHDICFLESEPLRDQKAKELGKEMFGP